MPATVPGLTAKDFHIFEDDKEVQIASVTMQRWPGWSVRDNDAQHCVENNYLAGLWDSPDLPWTTPYYQACTGMLFYRIFVVPNHSTTDSCHTIKVKVDRSKVSVFARAGYCDESSLSDVLGGSALGKELEAEANSVADAAIPMTGQAATFVSQTNQITVDIALGFPWKSMLGEREGPNIVSKVNLVALVYKKDGSLLERISEPGGNSWIPDNVPDQHPTPDARIREIEYIVSLTRYERQIRLPPGDYDLKFAITNGHQFGRLKMPLSVPAEKVQKLFIISIFLCKRFHRPEDAPAEAQFRDPGYVPLMSQGVEFTPAGDTHFRKSDHLILWFQIHPAIGEAAAQGTKFRITITSLQTGKLEADTGLQTTTPYIQAGSSTIDIAKEIGFDKLPAGTYRAQVQAIDDAGTKSAQSSTTFTVEGQ